MAERFEGTIQEFIQEHESMLKALGQKVYDVDETLRDVNERLRKVEHQAP